MGGLSKRSVKGGFSLVEIMVAIGILSMTILATNQFFVNYMRSEKNLVARSTRDTLVSFIRTNLAYPIVMLRSAPINSKLWSCIEADGTNCTAIGLANRSGAAICIPAGSSGLGFNHCDLVAGPDGRNSTVKAPVYYSIYGAKGQKSAEYPIAAIASFWASCADNAATCDIAETIYFNFAIYVDESLNSNFQFQSYPSDAPDGGAYADAPETIAVAVSVAELNKSKILTRQCPGDNMVLKGANRDLSLNCACATGFTRTPATGNDFECVPNNDRCPIGYDATGIYKDGKVKCQVKSATCFTPAWQCDMDYNLPGACNCLQYIGNDMRREVWITAVKAGECEATNDGKGGSNISCGSSAVQCCVRNDW